MTPALITILSLGMSPSFGSSTAVPQIKIGTALATQKARKIMPMHVSSSAFSEGQPIPKKYSCDGQNVSPPLKWDGVPENTKSVAIIVDDPDAPSGTFTHWILYDLPAKTSELKEGSSGGGKEGVNGFKKTGYGGPCPPPNGAHRYVFRIYALDIESLGKAGLSKQDITAAMKRHVLAEGQLIGKYKRAK
jgi:Raf kinase inhibitor-like YbhB/YbcL family protein